MKKSTIDQIIKNWETRIWETYTTHPDTTNYILQWWKLKDEEEYLYIPSMCVEKETFEMMNRLGALYLGASMDEQLYPSSLVIKLDTSNILKVDESNEVRRVHNHIEESRRAQQGSASARF